MYSAITILGIDRRGAFHEDLVREVEQRFNIAPKLFLAGDGAYLPTWYDMIDPTYVPPTWTGLPNSYKAFLCFQEIVRRANIAGDESILILEDDVQFTEDFDAVHAAAHQQLKKLEQPWDMLYLGANHSWSPTWEVDTNLLKLGGSVCWHAVAVRHTLYNKILDWTPTVPIDLQATGLHEHFNCYAVWPNIAIQRPGYSQVEMRERDYSEFWASKGNPCYTNYTR